MAVQLERLAEMALALAVALVDSCIEGNRLKATLERVGTAASDLYVVWGEKHGGALMKDWEHSEKLAAGFAAGETSATFTTASRVADAKYVRFLSVADGWSDSAYIPATKVAKGLTVIVRQAGCADIPAAFACALPP